MTGRAGPRSIGQPAGRGDGALREPASSPAALECPICGDEMLTMGQLNQHLDDAHAKELDTDPARKTSVQSWFSQQMVSALQQPGRVLLSQFGRYEPYRRNADDVDDDTDASSGPGKVGIDAAKVTDSRVSRAHWQVETGHDACSYPGCLRALGVREGRINCRHCGRLFCDRHTLYQMKLSRSAHYEPVRGYWCRVCKTCFEGREGYTTDMAASRDLTADFKKRRRPHVEHKALEYQRLYKRLDRLLQVRDGVALGPMAQVELRNLDQQIVAWQENASQSACPICHLSFGIFGRKHHCRTCGRVVCGRAHDLSPCVQDIEFSVKSLEHGSKKVYVPICRTCRQTLFGASDRDQELKHIPLYVTEYERLRTIYSEVMRLLPQFQNILLKLTTENADGSPADAKMISRARTLRKDILDSFAQFDASLKAIAKFRESASNERDVSRLCLGILQWGQMFVQQNLLPLQSLPRALGRGGAGSGGDGFASEARQQQEQQKQHDEAEAGLRERIVVMEEQIFLTHEMLRQAEQRRKYEDATALRKSLVPLEKELESLTLELAKSQLD